MSSLYEQYLDIYYQKADVEEKLKTKQLELFEKMKGENVDKVECVRGIITKTERITYDYSPEIQTKLEEIKLLKKTEEEAGTASKKVTPYIRVTIRKEI